MVVGAETAYNIWQLLEEQLLPATKEREAQLKNMLMMLKKGQTSLDEYLKKFKNLCDNLAAINQPVFDIDEVFQLANGLEAKYQDFRVAMLTKPPYPSFNQFVLALQGHEQSIIAQREEEKQYIDHAQVFYGQRGRNDSGGRGFNSRGRGFTPTVSRGLEERDNRNQAKNQNNFAPRFGQTTEKCNLRNKK